MGFWAVFLYRHGFEAATVHSGGVIMIVYFVRSNKRIEANIAIL